MAKIMVVDDEDDVRESTKTILEAIGHKVVTAKDGLECLAKLRAGEKMDLVLLDFFMPGMSGRDVLEEIRKDKKLAKTKVALMTVARMSETGEKQMRKLGMADFIPKLVDLADLKKRIAKLLK